MAPSAAAVAFLYSGDGDGLPEWAAWLREHPLALVNALFFLNVDVGFWVVGLLQGTFWLIDPYWTLLPVLIVEAFALHPDASGGVRGVLARGLIYVWSARLTHSYFRRENWRFGDREDWRFASMRREYGAAWPAVSFFVVFVAQHAMLVGLCLPAYAVFFRTAPPTPGRPDAGALHALDVAFVLAAAAGLLLAYFADAQLREFSLRPRPRRDEVLDRGLWRFSRHPNYFGEQLFWWAFGALGAVSVGAGWTLLGALLNSAVLFQVTRMTEQRMLDVPERRTAYRLYMRRTSVWLPLPQF